MLASIAAFLVGAGLTALVGLRAVSARRWPREATSAATDLQLGRVEPADGRARWREHCIGLQLSEEYVTNQTKQVIAESSCLMSTALSEALSQVQALQEKSTTASGCAATAHETAQSLLGSDDQALGLLRQLEESLASVDGMADLIATVAKRTNLLSLNATIEAARAGDAGKGFAVVAREVKELATVTARSTTEISGTVEKLRQQVDAVKTSLADISDGVTVMDRTAGGIVDLMSDQQEAMQALDLQVNDVNSQVELLAILVENVDRRQPTRIPASGVVHLDGPHGQVDGHLLGLSVGGLGCSVLRSVELAVGTVVTVGLPVIDAELSVRATVRRRTQAQGRDHLGLEFLGPSDGDLAAITAYISYLASGDPDSNGPGSVDDEVISSEQLVPVRPRPRQQPRQRQRL